MSAPEGTVADRNYRFFIALGTVGAFPRGGSGCLLRSSAYLGTRQSQKGGGGWWGEWNFSLSPITVAPSDRST